MKKIIPLLLLISTIFGCAEVPDEVRNDMNSYRNEERKDFENLGFTYVNISELVETSEAALSKEYTQFKISDKVTLSDSEDIYLMSFEKADFSDNISEQFDNAMRLFFEDSEINEQQTERIEDGDENYVMFDDTEKKVYGCVDNNGFISILKPDLYDVSFSFDGTNVKIYHVDRKEDLSDEYQLSDGKCSVEDAVNYVNGWLDTEYRKFSPEYDYEVETVIVREHEENYSYQFLVHALYKGVPIDSYTREAEWIDGEFTGRMRYWDYGIQLQMVNINEISLFTNGIGILIPQENEKIEECISLESALDYCENTFADFKNVTISDIDIMYTLTPVYDESNASEDDPFNFELIGYDSHPVWEFVIDVPPEDFLANGEVNTYGDIRKYIYIDMVTGELNYNFDIVYRH